MQVNFPLSVFFKCIGVFSHRKSTRLEEPGPCPYGVTSVRVEARSRFERDAALGGKSGWDCPRPKL